MASEQEDSLQPFQLSCELHPPHSGDVKAIIAIRDDLIATASRDSSVAVWQKTQSSQPFELKALLNGHHAYVNSLAFIPTDEFGHDNLLASGGNSALILLHSLKSLASESVDCLIGHALNVCTLAYSSTLKKLVSGSWDHTARIWSRTGAEWMCELVLEGHEEAVWGVAVIDVGAKKGCFLTGSADRLINLWGERGELLLRIKGSPEPVRGVTMMPDGTKFASACNDGLVRVWDVRGSILQALEGHTDYVYDVVLGNKGELLSCGEDHTVRIWLTDALPLDTLLHPCQTVWAVAALPNGDIISGGSDGRVRVWTTDPSRMAGAEIRQTYADQVRKAMQRPLEQHGNPADQIIPKELIIDIDISDDAPPLKLVYQSGTQPKEAAQAFGRLHDLSDNYVSQIEAFIIAKVEASGVVPPTLEFEQSDDAMETTSERSAEHI